MASLSRSTAVTEFDETSTALMECQTLIGTGSYSVYSQGLYISCQIIYYLIGQLSKELICKLTSNIIGNSICNKNTEDRFKNYKCSFKKRKLNSLRIKRSVFNFCWENPWTRSEISLEYIYPEIYFISKYLILLSFRMVLNTKIYWFTKIKKISYLKMSEQYTYHFPGWFQVHCQQW